MPEAMKPPKVPSVTVSTARETRLGNIAVLWQPPALNGTVTISSSESAKPITFDVAMSDLERLSLVAQAAHNDWDRLKSEEEEAEIRKQVKAQKEQAGKPEAM